MTYDARFLRRPLTLALAAALSLPALALAQTATSEDDESETKSTDAALDRITVVGSRIKRAEVEGPSPVTVITREDIDREGFQTVSDVLGSLVQNTSRSFTGDLAVTGFTPNAQVVNLRNLGPGYTLVLINGRRLPDYPQPYNRDRTAVNVQAIPTAIIERVEILAGGASAIYGSDAVAGVVNIVTRSNFDGDSIRATIGTTTEGGGDSGNFEFAGGRSGEDWNFLYALQYRYAEPIFASQRDFLADTRRGPLGPNVAPQLSNIVIRASASPAGPTNFNAFYIGEDRCNAFGFTTFQSPTRGLICGSYTAPAARSIANKRDDLSAYVYGSKSFDSVEAWISASYLDSEAIASSGTEFYGTAIDRFLLNRAGNRTSVYFDPQFGHLVQLQRVFMPFEVGGEDAVATNFEEQTYEVAGGLRGTVFDNQFDWDLSAAYARYDYTQDRPRLLNQAISEYFLGPVEGFTAAGQPIRRLNLERWATPITPEQYRNQFATRVINDGYTTASQLNLTVSGDLMELPAGALGLAAVVEYARQTVDLKSDPRTNQLRPIDATTPLNLTSSGAIKGDRDRYAAGVEFRIPILERLTAQAAARYDKYDDISNIDDAVTYNAGLEFRPWDSFLLRGSYATSFRAPDMSLIYAEGAAGFSTALDQFSCRAGVGPGSAGGPRTLAQCNVSGDPTIYQVQSLVAGNPLLEEEEGKSQTIGFVWDIMDNLSLSVDYYKIKLENAASILSLARILGDEANCRIGTFPDGTPFPNAIDSQFCQNILSFVTRQSSPGTILDQRIERVNTAYINTAITETAGADANLRYRIETDNIGSFLWDVSYSVTDSYKFAEGPDDAVTDFRDFLTFRIQRSRVRGSVGWNWGDWSTTVYGQRYGSVGNAAATDRLPPWMLYNLSVGKRFGENISAAFIVNNVLNNTRREDPTNTGYPYFDAFIGQDPAGRSLFMRVDYRF